MTFFEILKMEQKDLKEALVKELTAAGYIPQVEDGFIYAPGDVPVLMIAHMDTVHKERCKDICVSESGIIMSPQGIGGDDRCGIFMILETIKTHRCHVLFTEDEEVGLVGAKKFAKSGIKPEVNWILEYDRKGNNDAVFYSCDNPDFTEFITDPEIGFVTAYGSASDISDVAPAIDTAAVNLSCGYYSQHTLHEYVVISEMMNNIERGKRLIDKPCKHFKYIEKIYTPTYSKGYSSYKYNNYGYDYYKDYDCGNYTKPYCSYYNDDYSSIYEDNKHKKNNSAEEDAIRDGIYDEINTYAPTLFFSYYGSTARFENLIGVTELCDFEEDDYEVLTDEDTVSLADYYEYHIGDTIMIDTSRRIYLVTCGNLYGVEVAIRTNDYLVRKGGKKVLYFPETVLTYAAMTECEYKVFEEYVELNLELDIEDLVGDMLIETTIKQS